MLRIEKIDAYRKMKLWINELPENHDNITIDKVFEYTANKNIFWHERTLCLELRIAPRAVSNYGMLNLKFTKAKSDNFQVVYKICESNEVFVSDIAMQDDIVRNGIVKMYFETFVRIFDELSSKNIFPCGVLEILGGRYGEIGTSDIAIEIILKILFKLFELSDIFESSTVDEIIINGCKAR